MISDVTLEVALEQAWSRSSSVDRNNWTPQNPAWGQCAVTALAVQDYLGGNIVWANAVLENGDVISHYFNEVNGKQKDFTRAQFPADTFIPKGLPRHKGFSSTREYLLSNPKTKMRYELLKNQLNNYL